MMIQFFMKISRPVLLTVMGSLIFFGAGEIQAQEKKAPAAPAAKAPAAQKQKTASGLEYIIIEEGQGAKPKKGQKVKVHYTGKLENGTVFDSSIPRGQPLPFTLGMGQVIKGWDEGIALIKKGGKAQLIIPPALAYGARGVPPRIPANATLIFDVELVDIE